MTLICWREDCRWCWTVWLWEAEVCTGGEPVDVTVSQDDHDFEFIAQWCLP